MSTPFLSEIRIMSFSFAPRGWALCNGQVLPINQNQPLFSLLGTTYGGDGRVTFALPNLQGRVPMHMGNGHNLGETGGEESHVLSPNELPAHVHPATADIAQGSATSANPANTYPGSTPGLPIYSAGSANMVAMSPAMLSSVGGSQAHENRQPFLALSMCIAIQGIFPSQN
jgi:microcystin-dependent protein